MMPNDTLPPTARPHLLVALSPHGYGHAAMTAPVIDALRRRVPGLRLTLQTTLPADLLASRYGSGFEVIPQIPDFGLRQASASLVLIEESAADYRALHAGLDVVVAEEARRQRALGIDLVLSNVAYVPLLAARRAGIPAVALSCLNWADIYRHYFKHRPEAPAIEGEIRAAYRLAATFLRPVPAMPMEWMSNMRTIGPVARRGKADRAALRRLLGLGVGQRVGLIAFGGFDPRLSFADWPRLPNWRWVTTADPGGHPDMVRRDSIAIDFTDLLCSCDVVVTKPGYATFAEAAVNGIPVLYVPRPDWPETPHLVRWLEINGHCLALDFPQIARPDYLPALLESLFSLPGKPVVGPTGCDEGAEAILGVLSVSGG
jgi:hypothetical protein